MILIICGPAACGKTSIAEKLKKKLEKRGQYFKILHSDQFNKHPYEQMFVKASKGGNWILDGTFYKKKFMEKFEKLKNVKKIFIKASCKTCLIRNRKRANPIEEKAIHIIWNEFENPRADLIVNVDKSTVKQAAQKILNFLANSSSCKFSKRQER